MRTVVIVIVQLVISLFLTASFMPFVLIATPAAQSNPKLGLGIMASMLFVVFTLVALAWPRRLR